MVVGHMEGGVVKAWGILIGKGAVRSERMSFHTLTWLKFLGMVGS